jgi:hypothetical protein
MVHLVGAAGSLWPEKSTLLPWPVAASSLIILFSEMLKLLLFLFFFDFYFYFVKENMEPSRIFYLLK